MITKFDSLYAGHVDLDNVGYGGTPINDRRYSNEHLATALDQVLADNRNVVLALARHHTRAASDARTQVNGHAPLVQTLLL